MSCRMEYKPLLLGYSYLKVPEQSCQRRHKALKRLGWFTSCWPQSSLHQATAGFVERLPDLRSILEGLFSTCGSTNNQRRKSKFLVSLMLEDQNKTFNCTDSVSVGYS